MKTHKLTSVKKEGFMGRLYTPDTPSKKSVVVMTGGDGGIKNADYIAQCFAEKGINALSLAYFGISGVQKNLIEVPLECIESAVSYLKEKTQCGAVALYGLSKGAELSLLSASLIGDIDCVVAVVPNYYVASGFTKVGRPIGNRSSWSYRGNPMPYVPIVGKLSDTVKTYFREGESNQTKVYHEAEAVGIPEETLIRVEESHAAILCISTACDRVWLSKNAGDKIVGRLKNSGYPYAYHHESFEYVSHFLCPLSASYEKMLPRMFKVEKQKPLDCRNARQAAFGLAVDWIVKYSNV
ncbi:MAG: hypothetical protein LBL82_07245 [Oscillospiraceae bacterium]|nr:hypothetical protein [Oscillospiraceae bacterium]